MSEKGIPDLGLRETHDRSAFSNALEAAKAENPNGGMVDAQSAEGLERHYLSKGVPQETLDKMYTVGIVKDKA